MRAIRVGIVLSAVITDEHVFGQKSDRIEIQNTLPLVPKRADIWKVGSQGPSRCWMTRRKRRFGEVLAYPLCIYFFSPKKIYETPSCAIPFATRKWSAAPYQGTPWGCDNMSPTTGNIPEANGMFRGVGACCIGDMVIDGKVGHRPRILTVSF